MKISSALPIKIVLLSLVLSIPASPVWAATQTVTLLVPEMSCAACPITVKKALSKVNGVSKIDINIAQREAIVTFDNAKTNTQALTKTTQDAGYSSSVKP